MNCKFKVVIMRIVPFLLCFVLPLTLGSSEIWKTIQDQIDKFFENLNNNPTGQRLLEMIRSMDLDKFSQELNSPEGQRFMGRLQSPEGQAFVRSLNSPEGRRYLEELKKPEMRGYIMRCTLPPYPKNGRYVVKEVPNGKPGDLTQFVTLDVLCDPGYMVANMRTRYYCVYGFFGMSVPTECVPRCLLDLNAESIEYSDCIFPDSQSPSKCAGEVPAGTTVRTSKCRQADYFSVKKLPAMNCVNGEWDVNNALECRLDCGRVTPRKHLLVLNGTKVAHGDLPWHVGVYKKKHKVPKNICGGTIVKTDVVVSAAHCVWNPSTKKVNPATNYAVAAGKIYSPWDDPHDTDTQRSELDRMYVPAMYYGTDNNFANDIALLFLTTPFRYVPYIKPVCLNFGQNFENSDLVKGKLGTVAGWGYTLATGNRAGALRTTDLPYVPLQECMERVPSDFKQLLVYDKICAGYDDGTSTLCEGDSGGGLVFPREVANEKRYYLHGIVSASPTSDTSSKCNEWAIVTFTKLSNHKDFIRKELLAAAELTGEGALPLTTPDSG